MENQDTPSIEQQVNDLVANLGTEGFDESQADPALLFAAKAEKRRRDTQSEYTKVSQKAKKLEMVNNQLASTLETELVSSLPAREAAQLEELKYSDPDAWRVKLTELENKRRADVRGKLEAIEQEVGTKTELEQRVEMLQEFSAAHPGFEINDDVIANDIPPRITNKLAKGEISFTDFLEQCHDYLSRNKVIDKGEVPPDIPNLAKAPGGSTPQQSKTDPKSGYESEVY